MITNWRSIVVNRQSKRYPIKTVGQPHGLSWELNLLPACTVKDFQAVSLQTETTSASFLHSIKNKWTVKRLWPSTLCTLLKGEEFAMCQCGSITGTCQHQLLYLGGLQLPTPTGVCSPNKKISMCNQDSFGLTTWFTIFSSNSSSVKPEL